MNESEKKLEAQKIKKLIEKVKETGDKNQIKDLKKRINILKPRIYKPKE